MMYLRINRPVYVAHSGYGLYGIYEPEGSPTPTLAAGMKDWEAEETCVALNMLPLAGEMYAFLKSMGWSEAFSDRYEAALLPEERGSYGSTVQHSGSS